MLQAPKRYRTFFIRRRRICRQHIHGNSSVPYGIGSPVGGDGVDPIEDVCRQVLYHERMAQWQQEQLGAERFRIVQYEELCRDPLALAEEVSVELLSERGRRPQAEDVHPFEPSTRVRVSPEQHSLILDTFSRLEGREEYYWVEPWCPAPQGSLSA